MKNFMVVFLATISMLMVSQVEAGRFSSSRSSFSSSRSSFSSRASRPSYKQKSTRTKSTISTKTKNTKKATTSKFNAKNKQIKNSRFTKSKGFDKNKTKVAKASHAKHVSKFKKQPAKTTLNKSSRSSYSKNSYVSSTYGYNRNTRLSRRDTYYSSYHMPSYGYSSYNSFGMWDAMALWYILDHVSDRNQYQMAYHHRSDPGFQQWRQEADRLSADNAELRAQLNTLDKNVNSMNGTAVNDKYVPEGVDGDILLSDTVANSVKPELTICTGSITGSYSVYGYKMKALLDDSFDVTIKHTNGSNANILNLEAGTCDVALTQRDAYDMYTMCSNANEELKGLCAQRGIKFSKSTKLNFTRIAAPFSDSLLGVCNDVDYLSDSKIIALVNQGGDVLTWSNLSIEFPILKNIAILPTKSMTESLQAVSEGSAECTLIVTNTKSKVIKSLDNFIGNDMKVVNITNKNIGNILDPVGKSVYNKQEVPVEQLGELGKPLAQGWGSKYIETYSVPVDVIVSNKYNTSLIAKIKAKIIDLSL